MPPAIAIVLVDVNFMNLVSPSDIQTTIQRHGFVPLPNGADGTQLAVRNYEIRGVVCFDFLVFREVNQKGEVLRDEAALLTQALARLHTHLLTHPQKITSKIQSHAITFFGKKAYILTTRAGQLIKCRLLPLLILQSNSSSYPTVQDNIILPSLMVQKTHLEKFLSQNNAKNNPPSLNLETVFHPLQKSYHLLGLAVILLPLFLGLSGIVSCLGFSILSLPFILSGILWPIILLRRAFSHFHAFHQQNSITISFPESSSSDILRFEEPITTPRVEKTTEQYADEEGVSPFFASIPQTRVLLDSAQKTMNSALVAYQNDNWHIFSKHIQWFLIYGLQLSYLKQTGQAPPNDPLEILAQMTAEEIHTSLSAWFRRLDITRYQQPLSKAEAQQIMNFAIYLFRQQDVIPPLWENQVFQIIPRVPYFALPLIPQRKNSVDATTVSSASQPKQVSQKPESKSYSPSSKTSMNLETTMEDISKSDQG